MIVGRYIQRAIIIAARFQEVFIRALQRKLNMNCICFSSCPFFNDKMPIESGLGTIYKKKYCMGNQASCARYIAFQALGPKHVPITLYPSMIDVASQLIASARTSSSVR
jgi:hypothetical protein